MTDDGWRGSEGITSCLIKHLKQNIKTKYEHVIRVFHTKTVVVEKTETETGKNIAYFPEALPGC